MTACLSLVDTQRKIHSSSAAHLAKSQRSRVNGKLHFLNLMLINNHPTLVGQYSVIEQCRIPKAIGAA
jgi:hypothetical protein